MSKKTLANKYRPQNFSQLRGQDILVKILSNTIKTKNIANAYILTGIRGVGKTTSARIISKTLNCTNLNNEESIPVPCEQCKNCTSINEFNHPDVLEIDAASKTGVSDVREIIDSAKYKSVLGLYKIYIIDEVHMLSNSAFNALLKTLEEPPENILFIFATTEIQKIPATIISRCQRFDLSRLSSQQISDHLEYIASKESIKYTKEGLHVIAKFSEGSVRDSLSLLETINIYKNQDQEITSDLVNEVLGTPKLESIYDLVEKITEGDTKTAISAANSMHKNAIDINLLLEEILNVCNKVSKALSIKNFVEESNIFDFEKTLINTLKRKTDIISITNIWKIFFNGLQELKNSNYPFNVFEMIIIRACHLSNLPSQESILKKISSGAAITNKTPKTESSQDLKSFKDITDLFYQKKELLLYKYLVENVKIITYKKGEITAQTITTPPEKFTSTVINHLNNWTKIKWSFQLLNDESKKEAESTLQDQSLNEINNNE
ncbi:MAG: DNA polymerase III subunit gamma/tau, partial [Alphaproteobacteria bacterium]|nr:DNA polymerase III subunit gamma/tau [Alphaproteobacteria bacterium]